MLNNKNYTIAIVDSGIGGISVLKRLICKNHGGNYIYFADNLFMPYGKKSKSFLQKRLDYIIKELNEKYNVDEIIIACNTASSLIDKTKYKNVTTMDFDYSKKYFATELTKKNLPLLDVISDKSLAKLIEKNIYNKKRLDTIIKTHVVKYKLDSLDCFVLGCTHYELVVDIFKKYCPNTQIISNVERLIENIKEMPETKTSVVCVQSKQSLSYNKILNYLIRM